MLSMKEIIDANQDDADLINVYYSILIVNGNKIKLQFYLGLECFKVEWRG